MNRLLIVESPTKARTIGRMLGSDYQVVASMGHVRDLPERTLGVDIAGGFVPEYVSSSRSAKVVRDLRAAAKKADEIYLAPDPDREGEAIAWHLAEVLKDVYKKDFHRVTFHEITRSAIARALQHQGRIDRKLVDAQQARRVLDRIVGYQISPLLWSQLEKGISAGRVQSVALRLVVERERAIRDFQPEEYWTFTLVCATADGGEFRSRLFKVDGGEFRVPDQAGADALLAAVRGGSAPAVRAVTRQERRRYAPPPFTTSTLQQAANNTLRYSASSTMRYAQQLYEGIDLGAGGTVGLITYMRTDSVTIAREAQAAALDYIRAAYGAAYAPARPNQFKNKAQAQEAHEAIRPTDVTRTPESLAPYLGAAQLKLYTLIWRRFVASQMTPAVQNLTTVDVGIAGSDGREYTFRATATTPVFPGFLRVAGEESRREDAAAAAVLGALTEGQALTARDFESEQKFTEPPPRYTEASLIKELEENGIGRPSTYATILRTIQDRNYVNREQGKLIPTELGFKVTDFLVRHLPELFAVGFTAQMEQELDEVESGKLEYVGMLEAFYRKFEAWLKAARTAAAAPSDQVRSLLAAFEGVNFAPPEKRGRRTYDDRKFLESLTRQFEEGKPVSARQYQALLALCARYASQLKPESLPPELAAELAAVRTAQAEREARREETRLSAEQADEYRQLFQAFDRVAWEEPTVRRGRTYDDRKFFTSLQEQTRNGKQLSDKQRAALARLAAKYAAQLTDPELVNRSLGVAAAAAPGSTPDPEVGALLAQLAAVKTWAEPVRRGRATYDDHAFFESLSRQHREGRTLSPKQTAALRKLAAKYSGKSQE